VRSSCEFCASQEELVEFPSMSGSWHTLCMGCAGKIAVQSVSLLPDPVEQMVEVYKIPRLFPKIFPRIFPKTSVVIK